MHRLVASALTCTVLWVGPALQAQVRGTASSIPPLGAGIPALQGGGVSPGLQGSGGCCAAAREVVSSAAHPFPRRSRFQPIFLPLPYFDGYSSPSVTQTPPQVIVIREEREAGRDEEAGYIPRHVIEPKLIEVPSELRRAGRRQDATGTVKAKPPALLVFLDGHRIEALHYSIQGEFLYNFSIPRKTTKIRLDDLDLELTTKLNQERGIEFEVPANPNQAIVRF